MFIPEQQVNFWRRICVIFIPTKTKKIENLIPITVKIGGEVVEKTKTKPYSFK